MKKHGFTLVEMLVTLGVLGILLALVGFMLRVPSAQLYANDVQSMIAQARLQAIKHNRPVAVVWNSDSEAFSSQKATNSTVSSACTSTTVLATKAANEYGGNLTVTHTLSGGGLVWLPSGLLSTCSGLPTNTMAITITARQITRQLSISTAGEVSNQ
jgi:prepilin-type N-terminal cleavage/methylation domain-containing protein